MPNEQNKKIFKNAILLFLRMIFNTGITLYTSRILLDSLGIEDFGIYFVVAGFVFILAFLQGAMSSATQRFLSFELGKEEKSRELNKVFTICFSIHILIALIIIVIGETIGYWFIQNTLTIPLERLDSALWVFHFSLFAVVMTILSVPFSALLISFEKMAIYAKMSILDVTLKLFAAFLIGYTAVDHLILYSVLIAGFSLLVLIIYITYTKICLHKTKLVFIWDSILYKSIFSFILWNLWGSIAAVFNSHGINVLLNIFFGPSVNAASTIAFQASGALNRFTQSLQIAISPQIVKSFANNDIKRMNNIIFFGSKYSYFLIYLIFTFIYFGSETLLSFWLVDVPEYSNKFIKVALICMLIDSLSGPLIAAAQATGKIRMYQTIVGGFLILSLPLSYIFLKLGAPPVYAFYMNIVVSVAALISRLFLLKNLMGLSITSYVTTVLLRVFITTAITCPLLFFISSISNDLIFRLVIFPFISCIIITTTIFVIGLESKERNEIIKQTSTFLKKRIN
jgi:O-antigen/teichoic acid export membrane protein